MVLMQKKNRESHKKVYENKDFGNILTDSEDTKILEFNQYRRSDKEPFTIYTYFECLV